MTSDPTFGPLVVCGLGGESLEPAIIEQILKRTDGIPLFIEEFTKMVLGSAGTGAVLGVELPATLQDSLAARLDQLAPDKHAAQCAAVIGRTFSYDVLAAVAPLPEDVLQTSLMRLIDAGFITAHGRPAERRYRSTCPTPKGDIVLNRRTGSRPSDSSTVAGL